MNVLNQALDFAGTNVMSVFIHSHPISRRVRSLFVALTMSVVELKKGTICSIAIGVRLRN